MPNEYYSLYHRDKLGRYAPGVVTALVDRFEAKLNKDESGCWLWMGARPRGRYGKIGLGRAEEGEMLAHRLSWVLYRGPIVAGLNVLHRCDTPACVNPDHLFLGTQRDNIRDMVAKGRGNYTNVARGEHNGNSHLTWLDVNEIRELLRRGVPGARVARMFKVHHSTVYDIRDNNMWRET